MTRSFVKTQVDQEIQAMLSLLGGLMCRVRDVAADDAIELTDVVIAGDTNSANVDLTLPSAADAYQAYITSNGRAGIYILDHTTTGNTLQAVRAGADTINGTTAVAITTCCLVFPVSTSAWRAVAFGAAVSADTIGESALTLSVPVVIGMPFTLGNRSGPNSDGVQVGVLTHTAIGDCNIEDNSAGTFADDTTDVNDADANDVALTQPFDADDSINFGYAAKFCALVINVGTAGAGDAVAAETLWEYSQGSDTWASLETGHELTDDSVALTAGTSTYVVSFDPPADWATQAIDGGTALYHVQLRADGASDVYNTTDPLITQAWVVPLNVGQGVVVPFTCNVSAIDLHAGTASATNDDTVILIVNITQGTHESVTWTGGDVIDRVTGLDLDFTAGDEVAVVVIQEDGTTEFANATLYLQADI